MNLVDPELEFIDPTPNVHSLFIHFDKEFFWTTLLERATVRWSKRMYSCAGACSYEGRGGLVDIALSEPLLKLRPRKDLVETLLHEMIHAYLFIVGKDQRRDGHGPNFLSHMNRINKAAGVHISVYHDFHDEVKLYQNHVWRCNGPCQKIRPYFGIIRRSMNKAPGPTEFWWKTHTRNCGGTFIKCQGPEKTVIPVKQPTKTVKTPNADITKYINNNNNTMNNKNVIPKPVQKPTVFVGSGPVGGNKRSSHSVVETVRNVWANNNIPSSNAALTNKNPMVSTNQVNANKRLSNVNHSDSMTPPKKITKIDDYFKTTASSILKDVYGKDFTITQSSDTNKLKAVAVKETLVKCPICNAKVNDIQINTHLDECLNKNVIENLCKKTLQIIEPSSSHISTNEIKNRRETVGAIAFKPFKTYDKVKQEPPDNLQSITNRHTSIKIEAEKYISSNAELLDLTAIMQVKTELSTINCVDLTTGIVQVKTEPGTSNCLDLTTGTVQVKAEPSTSNCVDLTAGIVQVKTEPSPSRSIEKHMCPCCGKRIDKSVQEHLDECLTFFENNTTIPEEGASTSFGDRTIVIDSSDDEFDETQTLNATGTKLPCPCCMIMVEIANMNDHLDTCLLLKK